MYGTRPKHSKKMYSLGNCLPVWQAFTCSDVSLEELSLKRSKELLKVTTRTGQLIRSFDNNEDISTIGWASGLIVGTLIVAIAGQALNYSQKKYNPKSKQNSTSTSQSNFGA